MALMVSAPALSVRDLSFQYRLGTRPALSSLSFDLEAGEILLVAGGSGSGKSTLARCLNGLIPRSYRGTVAGSIVYQGQDVSGLSLSQLALLVGTLQQDPEKQIVASHVAEEVAFGPENLGWPRPRIRDAVERTLEELGISHLRDRETFHLSGGEKQKVALAGILAMEPKVLLLDEPLASLDPKSGREALALIRAQALSGRAVAVIEHRIEEVLGLSPRRVLHLEDGVQRFWGGLDGFLDSVDPGTMKLPVEHLLKFQGYPSSPPLSQASRSTPVVAEFDNVGFWYTPGFPVLSRIGFALRRGDRIAIMGPNGAGKSTLMKHLIGLLQPKEGRVVVRGQETRSTTVARLAADVGYVFQNPGHMLFAPTVKEELAFGPHNLKHPADRVERACAHALDVAVLSGTEERSPLSLSFGRQKRLGIAAVLAMGSRILVLDEPTAGQDYASQRRFMDEVSRLENFDALVFITHDLDLALTYANRVLLVADGTLAADGSPEEVLTRPELLERCHLIPTSLLELNKAAFALTGRFGGPDVFRSLPEKNKKAILDNDYRIGRL